MKCDGLLNREIIAEVAALGHTEYMCVADCGLPIPNGVRVIDISIVAGKPSFLDVVDAIAQELVIESIIIADEMASKNPALADEMDIRFNDKPTRTVSHEDFKQLTQKAKCIIRTGENSSYANTILVGGVNF